MKGIDSLKTKVYKIDWDGAAEACKFIGFAPSLLAGVAFGAANSRGFVVQPLIDQPESLVGVEAIAIVLSGIALGEIASKVCLKIGKHQKRKLKAYHANKAVDNSVAAVANEQDAQK